MPASYAINTEVATAKVIDGEAIVINVVTGRYYSLEGTGAIAWTLLSGAAPVPAVAAELARRYEVEESAAQADVERLAAELMDEDLLVATDPDDRSAAPAINGDGGREPYAPPALVTFSDMEELLAFDPPLPPTDAELWAAPPDQR